MSGEALKVIEEWFEAQGCNVEHGVLSGEVLVDLRSLANLLEIRGVLKPAQDS